MADHPWKGCENEGCNALARAEGALPCASCHGLGVALSESWLNTSFVFLFVAPAPTAEEAIALLDRVLKNVYRDQPGSYRIVPTAHPRMIDAFLEVERRLSNAYKDLRVVDASHGVFEVPGAHEPVRVFTHVAILFDAPPPLHVDLHP